MNKQLNKLKGEAIRKGAAELVTYTLGYDGFTKGKLVHSGYPMFQESQGAYEEYWYECLDLNGIGFLGEDWFGECVTEALMEKLQDMEYEFVQDVITGAMEKAYLSLKSLEYDTNLEASAGDQ
jgi:hypothetical protein